MQAQRLLLKTNAQGKLENLPNFAPNQDVEIIVLFNEGSVSEPQQTYRKPPTELAGKVKILGDIISPAVEENDWESLQ